MQKKLRVLVAPLNWGLGHATRDIPIIHVLLAKGAEVVLAGDGPAIQLLAQEFPQLLCFELPSWNITYPSQGNFTWHLFKQVGKVMLAIRGENKEVELLVEREKIDVIISDNRFGAFSKKVKSIVITHQLFLESPILNRFINWNNNRFLRKFDEVWIADVSGENNLSGRLSNRSPISLKYRHLGIISRFFPLEELKTEKVEILAIISGPEPQRTFFEEELLVELKKIQKKAVVLLGKPGESVIPIQQENLAIYNHLPGKELSRLFTSAEVVISRNGYTTVMDLVTLSKKAILVPTPGQPEQEYLADYYQEKNWFVIQRQGKIDLKSALAQLEKSGVPELPKENYLEQAVESLFS